MSVPSAHYTLKCSTRAVAACESVKEQHRFLVGTASVKQHDNEIHVIEYDESTNQIECLMVAAFDDGEVLSLNPHTEEACKFYAVSCGEGNYTAGFYQLDQSINQADPSNNQSNNQTKTPLDRIFTLPINDANQSHQPIYHVSMNPTDSKSVLAIGARGLSTWSINQSTANRVPVNQSILSSLEQPNSMRASTWDPHHPQQLVASVNQSIYGIDQRSPNLSHTITNAADDLILDLDFNPNKPYSILSAGFDRLLRIWDLRKPTAPLKVLGAHTHWVWQARYNRFHDQLIASAGSENVNLWSIVSTSSAPLGDLESHVANGKVDKNADKLVKTFSESEDSTYAVAWSAYDAWVFATASWDGRVSVNQVPPAEKYKILL